MVQFLWINFFLEISSIFVGFFKSSLFFVSSCMYKSKHNTKNWLCIDLYKLFLTYIIPNTMGMTHLKTVALMSLVTARATEASGCVQPSQMWNLGSKVHAMLYSLTNSYVTQPTVPASMHYSQTRERQKRKFAVYIYHISSLIRHIFSLKNITKNQRVFNTINKLSQKNTINSTKTTFLIIRCIISLVRYYKVENMVYCTVSTVFLSSAHCRFMLC